MAVTASPGSSSSSASGTPSSSRSPSPTIAPQPNRSPAKKKKAARPVDDAGGARNEGTNPHWAFKPPQGVVPLDHAVDFGAFDWDAANDDDVELWLVRVPADIKPKHLEQAKLDAPASARTARIGAISRKHGSYDIWSVGPDASAEEQRTPLLGAGAEEVRGLSCLLPRKRKGGKLFLAPKSIARHIVVTAQPAIPTSAAERGAAPADLYQNPPRHSYPAEVLKHRFAPYGSASAAPDPKGPTVEDDGDAEMAIENTLGSVATTGVPVPVKEGKEKKGKKRKVEKESGEPKKAKKAKVAAA